MHDPPIEEFTLFHSIIISNYSKVTSNIVVSLTYSFSFPVFLLRRLCFKLCSRKKEHCEKDYVVHRILKCYPPQPPRFPF